MIVSLILLIAARSMVSCATRLKFIPRLGVVPLTITGPTMQQGPRIYTADLPHPQMKMASPSSEFMVKLGKWHPWYLVTGPPRLSDKVQSIRRLNARLVVLSPKGVKTTIADLRVSRQVFPPMAIYGMDTRQLLHSWADSYLTTHAVTQSLHSLTRLVTNSQNQADKGGADSLVDPTRDKSGAGLDTNMHDPYARRWQANKANVLHKMSDVTAQATEMFMQLDTPTVNAKLSGFDRGRLIRLLRKRTQLEMVGLIPADGYKSFVHAMDASAEALCVFSREKLKDDSRGSLRGKVEEQYGKQGTRLWGGRARRRFDVFAIEGLVDAPGLTESSARDLLSRIAKYADEEQRIVVVPRRAYICSDGTDLTDYYVNLGFEKVEMKGGDLTEMKGRSHELVYTGISSSDENVQAENEQIMFGVDRWIRV